MKRKVLKIIVTIILSLCLLAAIKLGIGFFIALATQNNDMMFIYGLILMTISSLAFLFGLNIEFITDVWKQKKEPRSKK